MMKILLLLSACGCVVEYVMGSCCNLPKTIQNGVLTCNDGKLNIHCDEGFVLRQTERRCGRGKYGRRIWQERDSNFDWRFMSRSNTCVVKRCPKPRLENGNLRSEGGVYGDDSYGSVVRAVCDNGYTQYGSHNRTCQINSRWSGVIQTCQPEGRSSVNTCEHPGIPDGAMVTVDGLKTNDKITYQCSGGLVAFGDSERRCLAGGKWSGAPFVCYDKQSYDLVEDVTLSLAQNLDDLKVETCNHDNNTCFENYREACEVYGNCWMHDRMVNDPTKRRKKRFLDQVSAQHGLDLYIAIDNSDSISEESFKLGKQFVRSAIKKLGIATWADREQPGTRYLIYTFNDEVRTIVDQFVDRTINTQDQILARFDEKTGNLTTERGTSIPKVLDIIRVAISTTIEKDKLDNSKHNRRIIVILLSDGASNMGGHPKAHADAIKAMNAKILGIHLQVEGKTSDLDVMKDVISPNEDNRKYLYVMNNKEQLEKMIEDLLNTTTDYSPCGYQGHEDSHGLVSHGVESVQGQWPWMVQITRDTTPVCGSTILDKSTLLTAAHCFFEKIRRTRTWRRIPKEAFNAVSGVLKDVRYGDSPYARTHDIQSIKIHPQYDKNNISAGNDIAIVKLTTRLRLTHHVRPICINGLNTVKINDGNLETPGKDVTVAGWGDTVGDDEVILRHGLVQMSNDCDPDHTLCARTTGNVTCKRDSGGPLMKLALDPQTGKSRYYEIGIVSYGNEGAAGACKDVTETHFTKVSSYIEWIKLQIRV